MRLLDVERIAVIAPTTGNRETPGRFSLLIASLDPSCSLYRLQEKAFIASEATGLPDESGGR